MKVFFRRCPLPSFFRVKIIFRLSLSLSTATCQGGGKRAKLTIFLPFPWVESGSANWPKSSFPSPPPPPLGAQEQLFSFFRMQSTSARKGKEGEGGVGARLEKQKRGKKDYFSLPFNFLGKEQEEEERDRVREGGSITRWPARAEEEEEAAEAEYPVVGQSVVKSSDYRLIGILLAWTDDGGGGDVLARHSKGRDSPKASKRRGQA